MAHQKRFIERKYRQELKEMRRERERQEKESDSDVATADYRKWHGSPSASEISLVARTFLVNLQIHGVVQPGIQTQDSWVGRYGGLL